MYVDIYIYRERERGSEGERLAARYRERERGDESLSFVVPKDHACPPPPSLSLARSVSHADTHTLHRSLSRSIPREIGPGLKCVLLNVIFILD